VTVGESPSADVPSTSSSNELRAYPADLLRSPLAVSSAAATVEFGSVSRLRPRSPPSQRPFTSVAASRRLIERGQLSVGVLLLSFLIAAFWARLTRSRLAMARRWSPRTSSGREGLRAMHFFSVAP
jgi:hypothetical protein